jgi:uncharacterized protein YutE (UPF0331/DUF86 family)
VSPAFGLFGAADCGTLTTIAYLSGGRLPSSFTPLPREYDVPREVLLRKLAYLRRLLEDLGPYQGASLAVVRADHYKLERIFELLVVTATDILAHYLAERGNTPTSYRETFRMAGESGVLTGELAVRLQQAASMRNIIVHLYEEIDYQILRDSIDPALSDFAQFAAAVEALP